MLKNLWKVTVESLGQYGKTWEDVLQVQASGEWFAKEDAEAALKNTVYHTNAPGDEVAQDLVLVGSGWAMRWSQGWVWMQVPALLEESVKVTCPEVFGSADETDEEGCRVPTYNKRVKELKPKKDK